MIFKGVHIKAIYRRGLSKRGEAWTDCRFKRGPGKREVDVVFLRGLCVRVGQ